MRPIFRALLVVAGVVGGAGAASARPWPARHPRVEPPLTHQLVNPQRWPAEPAAPVAIDPVRFRAAFRHLCAPAAKPGNGDAAPRPSRRGRPGQARVDLGDLVLQAAEETRSDPFLLGALAFHRSHCQPRASSPVGFGLLAIDPGMYREPGAPAPPIAREEWARRRLMDPAHNLRVGARLLAMWDEQHADLDARFGGARHRTAVSHFIWGDYVKSAGMEDLVLTARRRLLASYNQAQDAPRPTSLGVALVPALEGSPRVASSGPGEDRAGGARRHKGLDLVAVEGEPVRAVADGVVTFAGINLPRNPRFVVPPSRLPRYRGRRMGVGGIFVCLSHTSSAPREIGSCYMHLTSYTVAVGDRVLAGQTIGFVGRTGVAFSPPHLHLELRINNAPVNPLKHLGDEVIPPQATTVYHYVRAAKARRSAAARTAHPKVLARPGPVVTTRPTTR